MSELGLNDFWIYFLRNKFIFFEEKIKRLKLVFFNFSLSYFYPNNCRKEIQFKNEQTF